MIVIIPVMGFVVIISMLLAYILYKVLVGVTQGVGDAGRYWFNKRKYDL